MVQALPNERRRHARHGIDAGVRIAHRATGRAFRGRYADLSVGGALLLAPVSMPVRTGQAVVLDPSPQAVCGAADAKPVTATIVRVDRSTLLTRGEIAVGVEFC